MIDFSIDFRQMGHSCTRSPQFWQTPWPHRKTIFFRRSIQIGQCTCSRISCNCCWRRARATASLTLFEIELAVSDLHVAWSGLSEHSSWKETVDSTNARQAKHFFIRPAHSRRETRSTLERIIHWPWQAMRCPQGLYITEAFRSEQILHCSI